MSRPRAVSAVSGLLLVLLVLAVPAAAEKMGTSGGYDLDDLWARAHSTYDLSKQDAIVLLESKHVSFLAHGNISTRVHRVVWIGTGAVVRTHADLRIPYNAANSELKVLKLRTWRDNRWWPDAEEISATAVVETLPYAVALADDYSTMRETMLLHDGVELPCIMETQYEIVERRGFIPMSDELWVFSQRDPAVLVELKVSTMTGQFLVYESFNGTPEPVVTSDDGGKTHTWTMENVDKLGVPLVDEPAAYKPHVAWSTWRDWKTLGNVISERFYKPAVASDALADTVAQRIADTPSPAATARAIADYVSESTRSIHYDARFWQFTPRPASRTWESAYGHGLDRAVLAATLFRDTGLTADLIFVASKKGEFSIRVPGLARFEHMMLYVSGDNFEAIYDPEVGTLTEGKLPLLGRVAWKPLDGGSPSEEPANGSSLVPSRFEVMLELEPDEEKGWAGTAHLSADGVFCPYGEMKGLENESLEFVKRVGRSLMAGADVGGFNPDDFTGDLVTVGYRFTAAVGDADDFGRTRVEIGNPAGGVLDRLPHDVSLYHESRESPVLLPGVMTQRIRARIKTGKREVIHLPAPIELKNEAGIYTLDVVEENGWVTIDQTLELDSAVVSPEVWPQLRALLLDVGDASHRTVLLK